MILGLLLSTYPKASELAKHLLGFKDLFLVGFFVLIGLSGPLTLDALGIAVLLTLLVPVKVALFFWLLGRFRLRARTSLLTSLSLANYSEFGLIVMAIAVTNAWIGSELLIIVAIAVSISFIAAAPLNTASHSLYARYRARLLPFQSDRCLDQERTIDPGDASVLIFGMGRVGAGAYDSMTQRVGSKVMGIDIDEKSVEKHRAAGRRVIRGNVIDPDFWARIDVHNEVVELVMLAMPNFSENLFAARQLRDIGYTGKLAAIARYPDEVEQLRQAGVDAAFNLYAEAGAGFADHVCDRLVPEASR
ncbi:NAD-binding protein [Thiogranum longum]